MVNEMAKVQGHLAPSFPARKQPAMFRTILTLFYVTLLTFSLEASAGDPVSPATELLPLSHPVHESP